MKANLLYLSFLAGFVLLTSCELNPGQDKKILTLSSGARTAEHPFPPDDDLSDTALYLNGAEAGTFTLERGKKYTFRANTSSAHPVYLTNSSVGGGVGSGDYPKTGEDFNKFEGATFTFKPGAGTPNFLYYQCANHEQEGYRLFVKDSE